MANLTYSFYIEIKSPARSITTIAKKPQPFQDRRSEDEGRVKGSPVGCVKKLAT